MIILAGTVRIETAKIEAARGALEVMVRASRAEPGCRAYSFAFDLIEPGLIRIFEIYDDADALAAHRASAHFQAWRAGWEEHGIGDRVMTRYEVSESAPT